MDHVDGILIYDEVALMRHRIGSLFQNYNLPVYEATQDIEVYKIFSDESIHIRLVLMELGADVNVGFDILTKIKERKPGLPIVIITSNNKRQTFLRCLSEGVADYILKPFEDEYLVDKVLGILKQGKPDQNAPVRLTFDIHNYLKTELTKAAKGKYSLTLVMCTLFDIDDDGITSMERRHLPVINSFYELVLKDIWDTDIFERYGSQTFIGVFPYCDEAHSGKITGKLHACFETVLNNNRAASALRIATAVLTCPSLVTDPRELLLSLAVMLDSNVDRIKKNDNPNT